MIKNKKGITLIALIVTIIILLLLAGITIATFKENGLLDKTLEAKRKAELAKIEEQLRLAIAETTIDKKSKITLDDYINKLIEKGIITNNDVQDDGNKKIITVDGEYIFEISTDNDEKIQLNYLGISKELQPVVTIEEITNTTNSITVKVSAKRNDGGKILYYIKSEDEDNYELLEETENLSYTYINLMQNKKYNIKVVAKNKNKQTAEIKIDRATATIITAEGNIKINTVTWNETKANTTIEKESTVGDNLQIQYQVNSTTEENWILGTTVDNLNYNDIIYARLWDGTNGGEYISLQVLETSHLYGDWNTITNATCTAEGTQEHICLRCGNTEKQTVTALGHSYTAQQVSSTYLRSNATCSAAATYYYKCARCTAKGTNYYNNGNALGHSYTAQQVSSTYLRSNATCTAAATYYYKCARCTAKGTNYYSSGSALGHSWTTVSTATCQSPAVVKCSTCGTQTTSGTTSKHYFTAMNYNGSWESTCNWCGTTRNYEINGWGD